jgi:hypothetical protein
MNAISPEQIKLDPFAIDPRSCEHCGLAIDRHQRVDTPEGPEFFCIPPDEMDMDELERRAELIRQVEVAAILARMDAMDVMDTMDRPAEIPLPNKPRRYSTPQATIDAFLFVARNHDADYVARWLENHPQDVATLTELWREKNGLP